MFSLRTFHRLARDFLSSKAGAKINTIFISCKLCVKIFFWYNLKYALFIASSKEFLMDCPQSALLCEKITIISTAAKNKSQHVQPEKQKGRKGKKSSIKQEGLSHDNPIFLLTLNLIP